MPTASRPPSRPSWLPAILLLALIFFLIFIALRVVFPSDRFTYPTPTRQPPTVTVTITPTVTPTVTPTITLTRRATITLRSSQTATASATPSLTPTITPTRLATLGAAKPYRFNDVYRLATWTPEEAARAIALALDYPNLRYRSAEQRLLPEYAAAHRVAALALREALLRFPNAAQADFWRWQLARSLAQAGDAQSGGVYGEIIAAALNDRAIALEQLPGWFASHAPGFSLTVQSLDAAGSLYAIGIETYGGGALFAARHSAGWQLTLLASQWDFAANLQAGFSSGDLTGDGVAEVILWFAPPQADTLALPPHVFDIASGAPIELAVAPARPLPLGVQFEIGWQAAGGNLRMTLNVFPACPVWVNLPYVWDGQAFIPGEPEYRIVPPADNPAVCEAIVEHVAAWWEARAAIVVLETMLPLWVPEIAPGSAANPAEAAADWQYLLGLSYALAGEDVAARERLAAWGGAPAQIFLAAYTAPQELYRACLAAAGCDARRALTRLTETAESISPPAALQFLQQNGVVTRSSGVFDFDADGSEERWLVLRHRPSERLEFWILTMWNGKARALFVDWSDSGSPQPYFYQPESEERIFQLQMGQGYTLARLPQSGEPYITRHTLVFTPTTFTRDALALAEQTLFSGFPEQARQMLAFTLAAPQFNCLNDRICDRFLYVFALASEMAGDEGAAIDTFIELWWEHGDSPYTTLARLKLYQLPLRPTNTPTISPTLTPSITSTPTVTHTPDPNASETPTPTETATATETPTITPTP